MTVYLSSSDLIPDSYSVLRGAVNNEVSDLYWRAVENGEYFKYSRAG